MYFLHIYDRSSIVTPFKYLFSPYLGFMIVAACKPRHHHQPLLKKFQGYWRRQREKTTPPRLRLACFGRRCWRCWRAKGLVLHVMWVIYEPYKSIQLIGGIIHDVENARARQGPMLFFGAVSKGYSSCCTSTTGIPEQPDIIWVNSNVLANATMKW